MRVDLNQILHKIFISHFYARSIFLLIITYCLFGIILLFQFKEKQVEKFAYHTLYAAIVAALPYVSVVEAAEYTERVNSTTTPLQDGDVINISQASKTNVGIWVSANAPVQINNGRIDITVNTDTNNPRGMSITETKGNNLGDGTRISVNSNSADRNSAIGINIVDNSTLAANNIELLASGKSQATAISMGGKNSQIDLNGVSSINVKAEKAATGALLKDNNILNFDKASFKVESAIASGVILSGDNSAVNLGSGTHIEISSQSNADPGVIDDSAGVVLSDVVGVKKLDAENLKISASGKNGKGIIIDTASDKSTVNLGANSVINTSGDYGTGLEIRENGNVALNAKGLFVQTAGKNANAMDAHSGLISLTEGSKLISLNAGGIYADNLKGISAINPEITLKDSEVNGHTFGIIASGDDTKITMDNTKVIAGTQNALTSISGSHISFSGNSELSSLQGNAIETDGDGSYVVGRGNSYINGNIVAKNQSKIELELNGQSYVNSAVKTDDNSIVNIALSDNSVWNSNGDSTLDNLSLNSSALYINKDVTSPFINSTVTVNGNYSANNAKIYFNSVLSGDESLSDKLIVKGNTSGNTDVYVNNVGGKGAETINGIELIHVDGLSNGEFNQKGRITAGAYDYQLVRGQGDKAKNWYLTSSFNKNNQLADNVQDKAFRPEGAAYAANLAIVNNMFTDRLSDRPVETIYTDLFTGEQKTTSLWLRQSGEHNRWSDKSGQLKTRSNIYTVQLGGDFATLSLAGNDSLQLGSMVGYGYSKSNTRSSITGYKAEGSVNGYSVGIYSTWFEDDLTREGYYSHNWLQYGWFDNTIKGQGIPREDFKSKGLSASIEFGLNKKIVESQNNSSSSNSWFIQPQAQVTWMGISADKHRENNGSEIEMKGEGNIQTRLGIRTYLKGHNSMDEGKGREFQPYLETNWIHNTRDYSAIMDGIAISQAGAKNISEIKLGAEGKINTHISMWGGVGVQVGDKGYSNNSAMFGLKYIF